MDRVNSWFLGTTIIVLFCLIGLTIFYHQEIEKINIDKAEFESLQNLLSTTQYELSVCEGKLYGLEESYIYKYYGNDTKR